ncbi:MULTISPECIES: hypothetical protein [Prevotellaceae]|uniref:hypothetical protein n=1 Tax=Prevotellaceae TaxID=171552 RepID=UPI0003D2E35B|nr:hypothetical protein [Prevotella phocaeensis]ETD21434.1 hypothetical protein HMPREF1199_00508 [Hoylesella oralis CC98A]
MRHRHGVSYKKRVADINRIYDRYVRLGIPNREIWRRYIYPVYGISERTFYYLLKASADPANEMPEDTQTYLDFKEE